MPAVPLPLQVESDSLLQTEHTPGPYRGAMSAALGVVCNTTNDEDDESNNPVIEEDDE